MLYVYPLQPVLINQYWTELKISWVLMNSEKMIHCWPLYIIGHYNPAVRLERQIFEKFFNGRFLYSQSFCQKSAERNSPKKNFIAINRFDAWPGILPGLYIWQANTLSTKLLRLQYNMYIHRKSLHTPLYVIFFLPISRLQFLILIKNILIVATYLIWKKKKRNRQEKSLHSVMYANFFFLVYNMYWHWLINEKIYSE